MDAALAHEKGLRARVEVALANERRSRVELPGAVVSTVSARVRRGDPEGTVVAVSGLRITLRAPVPAPEPLFERATP